MDIQSERAAPPARGNGSLNAHLGGGQIDVKGLIGRTQGGLVIYQKGCLVGFVVTARRHGFNALDRFARSLGKFNSEVAAARALLAGGDQ